MKYITPRNETYLAAELACTTVGIGRSSRCAIIAATVCRLGRSYARLSESMCSVPDEGDRVSKRRDRVSRRITELLSEFGANLEFGGLHVSCVTRSKQGALNTTVLL
jgi:hypothetical protein